MLKELTFIRLVKCFVYKQMAARHGRYGLPGLDVENRPTKKTLTSQHGKRVWFIGFISIALNICQYFHSRETLFRKHNPRRADLHRNRDSDFDNDASYGDFLQQARIYCAY